MHIKRLGGTSWLVLLLIALVSAAACAAPIPQTLPEGSGGEAAATEPQPDVAATETETETETSAAATEETAAGETATEETAAAAGQETYEGLPVGFTEEGFPYRGDPDAPITVYEFSDYQCPFCQRHVIQTEPALEDSYVANGDVRFVFRDLPLEALHPNAIPAAVAANCVGAQGIVPYWKMHDLLFRTQQEWAQLSDPGEVFTRLAGEAGVDAEVYATCIADEGDRIREEVIRSVNEAESLGFTGTPSFRFVREETGETFNLVGAHPYGVFAEYFDTIAAGGTPVDPAEAQRQQQGEVEIPFWATAEGLAPDPDNPGVTIAGDFWRGNPDAPLAVVEFSDFQCPYCRRHTLDTQPVLDEQFVDEGEVLWVFKHFPVEQTHPQAVRAAGAAQCAGDQGKFWEMHHLLFERTEDWSISEPEPVLAELAGELDLDLDQFDVCMDEEETYQAVLSDLTEGSAFVRGTPTFVILYANQGQLIPGALPADQFSQALTQLLEEARSLETE